ncbi:MAG: Crp/Fnr family transcriptional regulator [Gammaproteobacteria bacterium]|nr:Crp/Fnr family transcriptional regulator [Gammaproteobacteria bacterium]
MTDSTEQTDWKELFPLLEKQSPAIANSLQVLSLPAEAIAFHQGDSCDNYLLVLDGSIKVLARSESGREIVLYRVQRGGSCVLTTSCLLGHNRYPAEGITETPVRALAIPAKAFHQGLAESEEFRTFIFNTYGQRLTDVISLVESISFEHVNRRLARYLVAQASQGELHVTHQVVATELGSAREVISRQLKLFEQRGWIEQQRGEIKILQQEALDQLAHSFD